jgi:hypothetical protein
MKPKIDEILKPIVFLNKVIVERIVERFLKATTYRKILYIWNIKRQYICLYMNPSLFPTLNLRKRACNHLQLDDI